MTKAVLMNDDHNPADFATCPLGHEVRRVETDVLDEFGFGIVMYVCDTCMEDDPEGAFIAIPNSDRLSKPQ